MILILWIGQMFVHSGNLIHSTILLIFINFTSSFHELNLHIFRILYIFVKTNELFSRTGEAQKASDCWKDPDSGFRLSDHLQAISVISLKININYIFFDANPFELSIKNVMDFLFREILGRSICEELPMFLKKNTTKYSFPTFFSSQIARQAFFKKKQFLMFRGADPSRNVRIFKWNWCFDASGHWEIMFFEISEMWI